MDRFCQWTDYEFTIVNGQIYTVCPWTDFVICTELTNYIFELKTNLVNSLRIYKIGFQLKKWPF